MDGIAQNISTTWNGLEPRRKAMLAISVMTAVMFLGLLIRIVATPTMALLYSGLDSSAASGVIEALDRQNVPYEVRGDAIYVPSDERDRVRIALAGEGLPIAGAAGYELLDGLSGFGTTAEMFDAAYWRAKEGELARTLLAFDSVVRARVHIASARRQPFAQQNEPTASVTISSSNGPLTRQQAEAIRFLVSSAVGGLQLTNVAVIDQEHGVVLKSGDSEAEATTGDEAARRSEDLRRSVLRLLEARVGPGAAIVEVSVDTSRDSETIRERSVDPASRVIIHRDTEESTDAAEGEANGVTVASNLAEGDVEGGDQSSRQASRTRERLNYEVSEVLRESVRPPGEVRRITVAVMVDGIRSVDDDGALLWSPRPSDELDALRELVESAVGYDEARGDIVTIQSLELSAAIEAGSVAETGFLRSLSVNATSIVQIIVLGLVAVMLGLFVIRPILNAPSGPPILPSDSVQLNEIDGQAPAMLEAASEGLEAADQASRSDETASSSLDAGTDLRAQLEDAVSENAERAVRILNNWLDRSDPEQAES